jgi:alkanesulfonate monooxygenase SsuD/methylene tetrahydromethanopterin reductase-like flavin-dependent oxidoreductase (luciferase family)
MKFLFGSEAEDTTGRTSPQRYAEMVEQAQFAEQMGFTGFLTSEQHFNTAVSMTSAPECILAFVAAKTSTLRLRAASFVLLTFNHPVRVAERAATLDILSGGRFEIGTARSNNPRTIKAFQVRPDETRAMWFESMEVLRKALALDEFDHHGKYWDIDPPISLVPRPVQTPHPPIFVSATSIETHVNAGKLGIGVMTGNSLPGGWEYMEEAINAYRSGLENADPGPGGVVNDTATGLAVICHCAETEEQAIAEAEERANRFLREVSGWFSALSEASPEYASMSGLKRLIDSGRGMREIIDRSPYVTIGTPDLFIERAHRLEQLGYQEMIINLDGMPHKQLMSSIELIGKHVIPACS